MVINHPSVTDLGKEELVDEEDGEAAGGGAEDGVHDGQGDHATIISPGDAALYNVTS